MAQADLLVELIKSASNGDQMAFRKISTALIQEERSKGHRILADRLTKALRPNGSISSHSFKKNESHHKNFIFEIRPERDLNSLILTQRIHNQIKELVEEQHRSELLRSHNLSPRNRLLFAGPPGNGKTTLAEAVAYELMYPLFVVRYENLVGSYLGETSGRLKHLMDYAKTQKCVLFFDEFETLGKERGDTHETGEIKRIVSSLLLQIDKMPDYVVIIAASNHPELLDKAVWRRFQVRLELNAPTQKQLAQFIQSIGKRCKIDFGCPPSVLAKSIAGASFSEAEEFCLDIVRFSVLKRQTKNLEAVTKKKMEQWRNRLNPVQSGFIQNNLIKM